jgi:hypothetical protein
MVLRGSMDLRSYDFECDDVSDLAAVHRALVADQARNAQIVDDVVAALGRGRNCLVLTRRVAHLDVLAARLAQRGHEALVLQGGLSVTERRATVSRVAEATAGDGVLIIGTTPFIGEGFDAPAPRAWASTDDATLGEGVPRPATLRLGHLAVPGQPVRDRHQAGRRQTRGPGLPRQRVRDRGFRELPVTYAHAIAVGLLPPMTATLSTGCWWHKRPRRARRWSPATSRSRCTRWTLSKAGRPDWQSRLCSSTPAPRRARCRRPCLWTHMGCLDRAAATGRGRPSAVRQRRGGRRRRASRCSSGRRRPGRGRSTGG